MVRRQIRTKPSVFMHLGKTRLVHYEYSVVCNAGGGVVLAFLSFLPSFVIAGTLGVPFISLRAPVLPAPAAFSIRLPLQTWTLVAANLDPCSCKPGPL